MTKEKWSKRDRSILDGIRREDITAAVQMIRSIDAIEWKRSEPNGKTTKDGEEICSMPYPNYPEGVFEILSLTGIDSEYDIKREYVYDFDGIWNTSLYCTEKRIITLNGEDFLDLMYEIQSEILTEISAERERERWERYEIE
jgi:hypothetical protein